MKPTKSSCRELLRRGLIGQSETVRAHLNLRGQPGKLANMFLGLRKKTKHISKKATHYKKRHPVKKRHPLKMTKNLKKKMTNFSTKIIENVAFFTGHFLYQALWVALFIPCMVGTLGHGMHCDVWAFICSGLHFLIRECAVYWYKQERYFVYGI